MAAHAATVGARTRLKRHRVPEASGKEASQAMKDIGATKQYETSEAARILDLPEGQIRSCVRAGFLKPRRGPGRK